MIRNTRRLLENFAKLAALRNARAEHRNALRVRVQRAVAVQGRRRGLGVLHRNAQLPEERSGGVCSRSGCIPEQSGG